MIAFQVEVVAAIDDLAHQVAHLRVINARDIRPGNSVAIGVKNHDVGILTGPGDRHRTCRQALFCKVYGPKRQSLRQIIIDDGARPFRPHCV